jgi:Nuclear fragile X mental retardation-interacting protein 1 (NUFIP1)
LNTLEAIDAWIAERKKKWPSAARVEEKAKNLAEAIERGELVHENSRKRKRSNKDIQRQSSHGWGTTHDIARGSFPSGYGRARGRGRGRGIIAQSVSTPGPTLTPGPRPTEPPFRPLVEHDSSSASDEESSNSDMDPIKDAISSKPLVSEEVQLASSHGFDTTMEELDVSGVFKGQY